jgi:hypothetical protein
MIQIESALAEDLADAGTLNNPLICWNNFLEASGVTLTTDGGTEQDDGAAINATTGTTYDYWKAVPSGSAVNLQFDFNATRSPDFAAISAHNIADLGGTIAFQRWTGSTWTGVGTGAVTPTKNEAIGFYFEESGSTRWRLRITNVSSNQEVQIGVIFVGRALQVPQRIYQGYDPHLRPNMVDLNTNVSEGGNLLGSTVVRKGLMLSAEISHIQPSFSRNENSVDGFLRFVDHYNAGKGFYWAWRPGTYGDLYWAWRNGPTISVQNSGPKNYQSFGLNMRAYYDE